MTSSRSTLGRRAFLLGAGTTLALPPLSSLFPRRLSAQEAQKPVRTLVIYTPNGMNMADWTPAATGKNYTLSSILKPLAPIKSEVLVLSGIDNPPAVTEGFGQHAPATASFLTCTNVAKSQKLKNGISMDQVIANAVGHHTRFPSLQLGTHGGSNAGGCDGGYSCAYTRNISWANATTPLPKVIRPRAVFDLLFSGGDPQATAEERERRRQLELSLLDSVLDDAHRLEPKLGGSDRAKLDQYMTGIRELERRLEDDEAGEECAAPERPPADMGFPGKVKLMLDLMAIAVQCDLTRIITFMMGNSISGQSFPFIGINSSHHQLSHHQNKSPNLTKLTVIDRWEVEQFVYLVQKLQQMDDGDGETVLDNSMVYFSNEVSDGNSHGNFNLPVLLAGRGGGPIRPGRHVQYGAASLANLYISMMHYAGVDVDTFGDDGTKRIGRLV